MPPKIVYRCEGITDNGNRKSATLRQTGDDPKSSETINISAPSEEKSLIDTLKPGTVYEISLKEST